MSSSELKVKGHLRSKHVTPYERPKGVVEKVKKWLSPATWTGYFNNSTNHAQEIKMRPHLGQLGSASSPNISLTSTSGSTRLMEARSADRSLYAASFSNLPSPFRTEWDSTMGLSSSLCKETHKETHSPVSVQRDMDASVSNSDESWVSEDLGEEEEIDSVLPSRPTFISLSRNEDEEDFPSSYIGGESSLYTYNLGEGTADVVQHSSLLLTPGAEAPVERVTNPLFASQLPRLTLSGRVCITQPEVKLSGKIRNSPLSFNMPGQAQAGHTVVTSTYTVTMTRPLMSSTVARAVRLPRSSSSEQDNSPVTGSQEEEVQGSVAPSLLATSYGNMSHTPAMDSSPAVSSPFFLTKSSADTCESIRQSPFHSPFYSGRTAYGGAASGQRLRLKRRHADETESTVCVPVRARVCPSGTLDNPPSVLSITSKRILDSLQSSSSPLKDARRMPMRGISDQDLLPSKRRRISISPPSSHVGSPPPVTPLHPLHTPHLPPHPSQHLSVSSDTRVTSSAPWSTGKGLQPSHVASTSSSALPGFSLPGLSAASSLHMMPSFTSKPANALSGLKFTPVPVTHEFQVSTDKDKDREDRDLPDFSQKDSRGNGGGKVRAKKRTFQHFSRRSQMDEEESGFMNPMELPPSVGLSLGTGKSIGSIKFHADRSTNVATLPATNSYSTSPSFSFSAPTTITNPTSTKSGVSTSFGFSVPKAHMPSSLTTHSARDIRPLHPPSSLPSLPYLSPSLQTSAPIFTSPEVVKLATNLKPMQRGLVSTGGPALIKPRISSISTHKPPPPLKTGSVADVFKDMDKLSGRASSSSIPNQKGSPKEDSEKDKASVDEGGTHGSTSEGSWACTNCHLHNESAGLRCAVCHSPRSPLLPEVELSVSPQAGTSLAAKTAPSSEVCVLSSKADSGAASSTSNKNATSASCSPAVVFSPLSSSSDVASNKSAEEKPVSCSAVKQGSIEGPNASKLAVGYSGLKLAVTVGVGSVHTTSTTVGSLLQGASVSPGSWSCGTCMVSNKPQCLSCVACTAPKPGTSASWSCDTCMVSNKPESLSCIACTAPKPGTSAVSVTTGTASSSGIQVGGSFSLSGSGVGQSSAGGGLSLGNSGGFKIGGGLSLAGGVKFGDRSLKLDGGSGGLSLGNSGIRIGGSEGDWGGGGVSKFGVGSSELSLGSSGIRIGGDGGGLKAGSDGGGGMSLTSQEQHSTSSMLPAVTGVKHTTAPGLTGAVLGSFTLPSVASAPCTGFGTGTSTLSTVSSQGLGFGGVTSSVFGLTQTSSTTMAISSDVQTMASSFGQASASLSASGQLPARSLASTFAFTQGLGSVFKPSSTQPQLQGITPPTFNFSAGKTSSLQLPTCPVSSSSSLAAGGGISRGSPFVFSGANPPVPSSTAAAGSLLSSASAPSGTMFQANTTRQNVNPSTSFNFNFKAPASTSASAPSNVNLFQFSGGNPSTSVAFSTAGQLQSLKFSAVNAPVGMPQQTMSSLQFGSGAGSLGDGGLKIGFGSMGATPLLGGSAGAPATQNLFGGCANPSQSTVPFTFQASSNQPSLFNPTTTGVQQGLPLTFGTPPPSSFNFSSSGLGDKITSTPNPAAPQQQSPFFQFEQNKVGVGLGTSSNSKLGGASTKKGFNFSSSSGLNLNFGSSFGQGGTSNPPLFGSGPSQSGSLTFTADADISKRIIKKATRRKKT